MLCLFPDYRPLGKFYEMKAGRKMIVRKISMWVCDVYSGPICNIHVYTSDERFNVIYLIGR